MLNSISTFLPTVAWTVITGILLTLGDLVLREWLDTRWPLGFWVVLTIYMVGTFCMMMSFFSQNIAVATVAAVVANAVGYVVASYFIFGDTISALKIMGMFAGIVSFAILELA